MIRRYVLLVYWLPARIRCEWRRATGRLYVFRNEPTDFLRYMVWLTDQEYEEVDDEQAEKDREGDQGEVEEEDDFDLMVAELHEEVELRKRRGEWD